MMDVVAYRSRTTRRYPISLDEIRQSVPMLFGAEPTEDVLEAAGVDPVIVFEPPAFDPTTHRIVEGEPVDGPNGWTQSWAVQPLPPQPVRQVSAVQAKTALHNAGLYAAAETAVANHPYELFRIWWGSAQVWREDHPYVAGVAAELGLTETQVGDLFTAAEKVPT